MAADLNNNGLLDMEEIQILCKLLSVSASEIPFKQYCDRLGFLDHARFEKMCLENDLFNLSEQKKFVKSQTTSTQEADNQFDPLAIKVKQDIKTIVNELNSVID